MGVFCPQSQPMQPTGAIPKRPRLTSSPSSGSSLGSELSSRTTSRGGFPLCKTTRHFNPPSIFASAVATTAAALKSTPSALPLGIASSSFPTALSVPDDDGFTTVSSKRRLTRTAQATTVGGKGKDGSSVILPKSTETFQHLQDVAVNCSTIKVKPIQLDPHSNTTRGVVLGYPLCLPTDLLLRHPQVKEATCCHQRGHTPSNRHTTWSSSTPVVLGQLGDFLLPPLSARTTAVLPLLPFGHYQASCENVINCGMCSGSHEIQECLVKYKAKQDIVHSCPNRNQAHHAWIKSCSALLRLVEWGRERQAVWVTNQQKSATIPAPHGTFVWGVAPPPAPRPTPTDFPSLPQTDAAPRQSLVWSLLYLSSLWNSISKVLCCTNSVVFLQSQVLIICIVLCIDSMVPSVWLFGHPS